MIIIKILWVIALALILAASISTACAPAAPTEPTFHPEIIETRYADGVRCYSLCLDYFTTTQEIAPSPYLTS